MTKGFLFPWFLESELAAGFRCGYCGRTGQAIFLRAPRLERSGCEIRICYPAKCSACGTVSVLGLRMSVLLCGWALLWSEMYAKRRRRDTSEKCVKPARADTFARICAEFSELLAQHGASTAGLPTDIDGIQLGLNQQDWADFLKRLGLGEEQKHEE